MPQIALAAVIPIVSAASTAAAALGSVAVSLAVSVGVSAATALLQPDQRAEGQATAFRADTDAGVMVAYGRIGTAGVIAYRVAYGPTNRYQSLFCTVSAGPIKSIVSFAADDEVTNFDGTLNKATDGAHAGFMWLQTKLGTQPQTALTSPTGTGAGDPAPDWTADHKQSGFAVYCLTMFENSKLTEFQGGVVKPLIILEGVYGWDPREDSTYPGGSGACRLLDPTTWVWIENPAIAALNWAIGRWAGDSGGGTYGVPYACSLVAGIGAKPEGIDVAAFVNAANVAEENGWAVAAYPSSKDDKYQVLTNLLQAAGATPSRVSGRISCISDAQLVASAVTVTARDTAGPVELSLGQSRLERINTIYPRFWSEEHRWDMVQIAPISNGDWLTQDGGIKRSRGVDYPNVPLADQAAQLAYYDAANAREPITGTVPFKPHMRRVSPGDCFTFSEPGFLLDGVKLRCRQRQYDPMTGVVRITFRSETDAKHTDAYEQTGTTPPPVDPGSPPPPYVEPPTDFTVTPDDLDMGIAYRNPDPVRANHDFVNVLRADDSLDFDDASIVDYYAGAPGEFITLTDTVPGPDAYGYWLQAVDTEGNFSDPLGPVQGNATLEPDTNLLTAPSDFSDAAWEKGQNGTGVTPVVTTNTGAAPDGTTTADRIQFVTAGTDGDASDHSFVRQLPGGADGAQHGAIWMKSNTSSDQTVYLRCSGDQAAVTVKPYWTRFAATGNGSRSLWVGLRGTVTGTTSAADVLVWQGHLAMD
ncbi:MAG: hypothetical protein ACT6TH_15240 [Brevundimonas sp.]|uniref:hypothetical protein n=1 Tax=Brevundimonas sp. TaxID=1871086 RepID=UPI004033B364